MTSNSSNNQLLGFTLGQIPVSDANGKILAQSAPAPGYVLTGSTSSTTGLASVALPAGASVLPSQYSTSVAKWSNSRQVALPSFCVADSTNSLYIQNQSATVLDINQVNVNGGMNVSSSLTGTITINQFMVSGIGTSFTTQLQVGDVIYLPNFGISRKVVQINSNTELLTDSGDTFSFAEWYVGTATAAISTSQSKFGGSSLLFSGAQTADMYFYYPTNSIHQSEFTIETNFYCTALPTSASTSAAIFNALTAGRYSLYLNSAGKLVLYISSTASANDISGGLTNISTIAVNSWVHVALTYYFGVYTLWVNGKAEITIASNSLIVSDFLNQFRLGCADGTAGSYFTGYIDETRISSCARYLAAFTPPTSAFSADASTLMLNHWDGVNNAIDLNLSEVMRPSTVRWDINYYGSPSLVTAQSKFGGYSMSNSATSGVAVNTGITQGVPPAQSCTEFWFYSTAATTAATLIDSLYSGYTYNINLTSAGKITYSIGNNGTSANIASGTSTTVISGSTWYHIALSFDGSNYRLFINGVLQASSAATTQSAFFARSLILGCANGRTSGASGYFDEFRFSNTARYTANFTPSTTAFTSDSNTIVLNHFDGPGNGAIYIQDGEVMGAMSFARGGLARNTHYYPYALSNGTSSQIRLFTRCLSYGDTLLDLPSGYTYFRQMKFSLLVNSRDNLMPFTLSGNLVSYSNIDDTGVPIGFAGDNAIGSALTATAFSALSCINLIPKISQEGYMQCYIWNNSTTDSGVRVRSTGSSLANGQSVAQQSNQYINGSVTKTTAMQNDCYVPLSSAQQFDYKVTTSGAQCGFLVKGYKITEV